MNRGKFVVNNDRVRRVGPEAICKSDNWGFGVTSQLVFAKLLLPLPPAFASVRNVEGSIVIV